MTSLFFSTSFSSFSMATIQFFVIFAFFQSVLSAPILSPFSSSSLSDENNNNNQKFLQFPSSSLVSSFDYPLNMEIFKRDFEEPFFIDPPEDDPFNPFYNKNLQRTDRKHLIPNNFFDTIIPISQNSFESLPIDPRSYPMMDTVDSSSEAAEPSQKEILGTIVVGPQTKSTQTSSAKKN
jgi:hypothetical protein